MISLIVHMVVESPGATSRHPKKRVQPLHNNGWRHLGEVWGSWCEPKKDLSKVNVKARVLSKTSVKCFLEMVWQVIWLSDPLLEKVW